VRTQVVCTDASSLGIASRPGRVGIASRPDPDVFRQLLSFHPLTVYPWRALLGMWTSPIGVLLLRLLYLKKTDVDFPFLVARRGLLQSVIRPPRPTPPRRGHLPPPPWGHLATGDSTRMPYCWSHVAAWPLAHHPPTPRLSAASSSTLVSSSASPPFVQIVSRCCPWNRMLQAYFPSVSDVLEVCCKRFWMLQK
jgi:hypothetical protein